MLNKIKAFMLSRKAVVLLAVFIAYAFFSVNNAYALFEVSIKKLRNLPKTYQYPAYIGDNKLFFAGDYKEKKSNKPEKITCASVYDMKKQKNIPLNSCMNIPRSMYVSIALPEDRVLVLGGDNRRNTKELRQTDSRNAEIYDVRTNKFRVIGNSNFEHRYFSEYLKLSSGKILILGNASQVEIFDPKTEKFEIPGELMYKMRNVGATSSKKEKRYYNIPGCCYLSQPVELNDGKVFFAAQGCSPYDDDSKNTAIYDPKTNKITVGPSQINLSSNSTRGVSKLSDGRVILIGVRNYKDERECEIYDPKTNTFTKTGKLKHGRRNACAFNLKGKTYVYGGSTGELIFERFLKTLEVYNEKTEKWKTVWNLEARGGFCPAVQISDKEVFLGWGVLIKAR